MRFAATVLMKELRDHLRDRRSLLAALVLPISGPLCFLLLFFVLDGWMRDRPITLPIQGAERAPGLVRFLEGEGITVTPIAERPEARVKSGESKLGLIVEPDFGDALSKGEPAALTLVVDRSNTASAKDVQRVQMLLFSWSQQLGTLRLFARGVDPTLAQPMKLSELDIATPAQRAAQLLTMIPLFLMMAAFIGGMNLVIDVTAGERERGSLEPLLLSSASRLSIVLGKWAAAVVASIAVVILCLVGFALALLAAPLDSLGIPFTLTWGRFGAMLAILVPLTFVGAALQMLVATFAHSFKEAQTYLSLFNLIPTLPAVLVLLNPFDSALWMSFVPVLSQQMLVLDVVKLMPLASAAVGISWMTSLLYSGATLWLVERLFHKEAIIYGR
ncbi:MAG: ABC transporter permease [Myxococcales bacterium]|jgi:sodium transport system permease protein|nr:ABC transporter permease [Myxococcales bacterium]